MIAADVPHLLGEAAVLVGSLLIFVASVGVLRFPDALTRMHALTKASTAGASVALVGVAVSLARADEVTSLLFATFLQAATNPVASILLTHAAYYAEGIDNRLDSIDELGEITEVDEVGSVSDSRLR